jgi:hypothetical protein
MHLPAYEDGIDTVFRNVGIQNSDAGELPRRKHATLRTQRKFEIKKINACANYISPPNPDTHTTWYCAPATADPHRSLLPCTN